MKTRYLTHDRLTQREAEAIVELINVASFDDPDSHPLAGQSRKRSAAERGAAKLQRALKNGGVVNVQR